MCPSSPSGTPRQSSFGADSEVTILFSDTPEIVEHSQRLILPDFPASHSLTHRAPVAVLQNVSEVILLKRLEKTKISRLCKKISYFNPGSGGGLSRTDKVFPGRPEMINEQRRCTLHSCSMFFFAHILKIVCPGHFRSGNQVRSSDHTSENIQCGNSIFNIFI